MMRCPALTEPIAVQLSAVERRSREMALVHSKSASISAGRADVFAGRNVLDANADVRCWSVAVPSTPSAAPRQASRANVISPVAGTAATLIPARAQLVGRTTSAALSASAAHDVCKHRDDWVPTTRPLTLPSWRLTVCARRNTLYDDDEEEEEEEEEEEAAATSLDAARLREAAGPAREGASFEGRPHLLEVPMRGEEGGEAIRRAKEVALSEARPETVDPTQPLDPEASANPDPPPSCLLYTSPSSRDRG
eukprot:3250592-Rhodomonas_salina.1